MAEELNFEGELLHLLDQRPFSSFNMVLTSGDRLFITATHEVAGGRTTVFVMDPQLGSSWIRKNQIVALMDYEGTA